MATKDLAEMIESERQREAARIRKAIAARRVALDRSDTENALAMEALEAEAVELERFGERQRLRDAQVRKEAFRHTPHKVELDALRMRRAELWRLLEDHRERVRNEESLAAVDPATSHRPGAVRSRKELAERRLPVMTAARDRAAAQFAEAEAELKALEERVLEEWVRS